MRPIIFASQGSFILPRWLWLWLNTNKSVIKILDYVRKYCELEVSAIGPRNLTSQNASDQRFVSLCQGLIYFHC